MEVGLVDLQNIDCCGSFVGYSPELHIFVISRAVERELLPFDDAMRKCFARPTCSGHTDANQVP